MATVTINFEFSDDSSLVAEFEGCAGVGGEVSDYGEEQAEELAEDCDGNPVEVECTGFEVIDFDCSDYMDMEAPDDFDDLDAWGEYCDLVEEHGEAFVLRHADWSGHTSMDNYHGCWASQEEFVQNLCEECCGLELPNYIYIDWERTARDIMMDYSSYEGNEGIHIFRD